MSQTLYQDAIETEIGGATVPALASNGNLVRSEPTRESFAGTASESRHASMVHEPVRGSIADTAPDYQRNSVVHGSTNLDVFHADLPPMYDEAVERRESSVPALAEKEDMKMGD
ncbi:hypothetical protein IWW50_001429 [Coemansia erecta]|nr:hypothetical protein IWW50_001429 [Coemansia erecta]